MRKLITIILVLAASVAFSQTTYQLNYDSIRVGKTEGTGATSLYGKTYLKNATEGAPSDSVLTVRNGRVYKIAGSAISSVGFLTYVFSRDASDIAGYEQMPALTSYTAGAADTATVAATTTPAIIQEFATNTGFPNTTLIPAGVFNVTYQTQKNSGSQSYYTYAVIYKRNLAGSETAIATTNNSSSVSANTVQSVSVSAVSPTDISLLTTDRIVVKVFAVMVSGTADISIYYDDATDSRLAFPSALVDASNFVPYNGAVKDLVSAFSITGDSIKRVGGTGAQFLKGDGSVTLLGVKSISQTPDNNGLSYSNDTLRLHAVTPTTGGVLTNGTDSIGGDKFFTNDIWVTDSQISDGHVGLASGSGSLHAPLLGASSESATNLLEILAHPAANRYNMNPANGIKFQVYINEGPDPITSGNAYNFKNGSSELLKISPLGQAEFLGDIITYSKRVSNGGVTLGSGSGSLMSPSLGGNSESSTAWFNFTGQPATNIDNTNPTDAFKFTAYKSNDGSQALTGGNLVNFFNKDVSKFKVDYNGAITSTGTFTSTLGNNTTLYNAASATTGYQFFNMQNTAGRLLWGIDGSSGGSFMTGGSAYSGAMTTVGAKNLELGTNQTKAITIDGTTQDVTISNNISAANLTSGTYTPTLTNGTNVASSSNADMFYQRVGNTVSYTIFMTVITTASGSTQIDFSLPVASNFSSSTDLKGTSSYSQSIGNSSDFTVSASIANDRAVVTFNDDTGGGGVNITITGHYKIL